MEEWKLTHTKPFNPPSPHHNSLPGRWAITFLVFGISFVSASFLCVMCMCPCCWLLGQQTHALSLELLQHSSSGQGVTTSPLVEVLSWPCSAVFWGKGVLHWAGNLGRHCSVRWCRGVGPLGLMLGQTWALKPHPALVGSTQRDWNTNLLLG